MPEFATQEQLQLLASQVANLVIQNLVSEQVISALLATHQNPRAMIEMLQATTPNFENHLLFSTGVSDAHLALFHKFLQVRITALQQYAGGKN